MDNIDLLREAALREFTEKIFHECKPFSCGDADLDDFFSSDVFLYDQEMLGKSYCWVDPKNPSEILAIVTLAYDGVNAVILDKSSRNALQRRIPNNKRNKSYPAVLIGRLGVNKNYQGKGLNLGTQIIKFLQYWFSDDSNKAACRFLLVDAYNIQPTLNFYEKNGFKPLYKTENLEKRAYGIEESEPLRSRVYFFDLKLTK